eukprot:1428574-Pyramimonas_sp.AAC.1
MRAVAEMEEANFAIAFGLWSIERGYGPIRSSTGSPQCFGGWLARCWARWDAQRVLSALEG